MLLKQAKVNIRCISLLMIARIIFIGWPSSPTITSIKPPPRRSPCEESASEWRFVFGSRRVCDLLYSASCLIFCLISASYFTLTISAFACCFDTTLDLNVSTLDVLDFDTAPHLDYVQALCGEIAALEQDSTKSALKSPVDAHHFPAKTACMSSLLFLNKNR